MRGNARSILGEGEDNTFADSTVGASDQHQFAADCRHSSRPRKNASMAHSVCCA
jgi:hypothetical protein